MRPAIYQFSFFADGTFIGHDVEIIPLYDPPHLLKCIRNNLLHKDLEFAYSDSKDQSERKFAQWQHIITAYEINRYGRKKLPALPKLTDQHVYPDKIKKMSCKLFNQAFSGELSAEIQTLAGGPGTISLCFYIRVGRKNNIMGIKIGTVEKYLSILVSSKNIINFML